MGLIKYFKWLFTRWYFYLISFAHFMLLYISFPESYDFVPTQIIALVIYHFGFTGILISLVVGVITIFRWLFKKK